MNDDETRTRMENNCKALKRLKYYTLPNYVKGQTRWKVIKTRRVGDILHMLAHCQDDYVVFSFWLDVDLSKYYPADTFADGPEKGRQLFEEIASEGK